MKLDIEKGNRFFRSLFSDYVESIDGIYFEHSPGRGKPAYANDYTAFDVFIPCTTVEGAMGLSQSR